MRIKYGERKIGDVKRNFSDISKAKNILGWQPLNTFEDGINKTINYFMALNNINAK